MSEDLEALRRRLYSPDATETDRARYRELAALTAAPDAAEELSRPDAPTHPEPAAASIRPRRRLVVGAAVAATVLVLGGVLAALVRPAPAPLPSPSPTATPSFSAISFDDTSVALPAAVRATFIELLRKGRSPELLQYVFRHPDVLPAQLRTPARADSVEFTGQDHGGVSLEPSAAADRGGHLTIAVTTDRAESVSWTAIRTHAATTQSEFEVLDAEQVAAVPGLPAVRTFAYRGEAPTLIAISAPTGVHWDVVAVFTD